MRLRKLRIKLAIGLGIALLYSTSHLSAEQNILQSMEQQFQSIVNAVKPSVVEVIATRVVSEVRLDPVLNQALSDRVGCSTPPPEYRLRHPNRFGWAHCDNWGSSRERG